TIQVMIAVFALTAVAVGVFAEYGPFSKISQAPATTPLPFSTFSAPCVAISGCQTAIKVENALPGTSAWTNDYPYGAEHDIEGFASPPSVNLGETVNLYISTTAKSYSFQVFRLGYYHGLGGRLVYTSLTYPGFVQPKPLIDPNTRMVSCANWRE